MSGSTFASTVSIRTVAARLARHFLREDGEILKRCHSTSRDYYDLGDWYTVDADTGMVMWRDIDIEGVARDRKILADHETVTD